MGTLAMIAGSLVGMYFVTVAAMPISVKYGIDTIAACKPQYGSHGSAFGIFAQYTSIIGWNCILIIILGRSHRERPRGGRRYPRPHTKLPRLDIGHHGHSGAHLLDGRIGGSDSVRDNSVWIAVAVSLPA